MRTQAPITNVEHDIPEGEYLVTKTDLQGRILYANPAFIDISGHNESELIGQPHNLVRHPDMPREVFEDMWTSLRAGQPWNGYVKNRCKNGDYYWTEANASPIFENGNVNGYMSVRKRADRSTVEDVERSYRKLREGKSSGLSIHDGKIVQRTAWSKLTGVFRNLKIKHRFQIITATMALALIGVGGYGIYGMKQANESMNRVYAERVVPMTTLKGIADDYAVHIIDAVNKANAGLLSASEANTQVGEAMQRIQTRWKEFSAQNLSAEERALANEAEVLFKPASLSVARVLNFLGQREGSVAGQLSAFDGQLYKTVDPISTKITELIDWQLRYVGIEYGESVSRYESERNAAITITLVGLTLLVLQLLYTYRSILRPVSRMREQMLEIAQGNLNLTVERARSDEIGCLADGFRIMFTRLGFDLSESQRRANEMSRIKEALDNVSTAVTVSDEHNSLIYMNRAGEKLFDQIASDRGGARSLIGGKLSSLMPEGDLKSAFTAQLSAPITLNGELAKRHLQIRPSPVNNAQGNYIGRVTEWQDRTAEIHVEREVADMVEAVANGDFTQRLGLDSKQGFILSVSEGINRFVEATESGLNEVVAMLRALSEGRLDHRMTGHYAGTFEQLKSDANTTVDTLTEIIGSIRNASNSINSAATQIAAGNADLSSRTESQSASIEETAASMEQLTSTVKNNANNAREASDLAQDATNVAVHGGEVVGQVVNTMGVIADSSRKIADIISVIDGIAFQTNILALNAAVEAARAGEQGRGFAVVAGEVRNLAQRSAAAAKEIKDLIHDSVNKVEDGHQLVTQAGETMEHVVASIKKVSHIMTEISSASAEQSSGIEQVNIALTQMDEGTQQNAALVEEAAAAARSMEEQATQLVQAVDVFKTDTSASQRWDGKVERRSPQRATNVERIQKPKVETWTSPAPRSNVEEGDWAVF